MQKINRAMATALVCMTGFWMPLKASFFGLDRALGKAVRHRSSSARKVAVSSSVAIPSMVHRIVSAAEKKKEAEKSGQEKKATLQKTIDETRKKRDALYVPGWLASRGSLFAMTERSNLDNHYQKIIEEAQQKLNAMS